MVMAIGLGPIDCKFKSYRSEPTKACFRALLQKLGKRGLWGNFENHLISSSVSSWVNLKITVRKRPESFTCDTTTPVPLGPLQRPGFV